MDASTEATRGLRGQAPKLPAGGRRSRLRGRSGALLLAAVLLTTACASTPTLTPAGDRGVRRCDRNGDYEERMACR